MYHHMCLPVVILHFVCMTDDGIYSSFFLVSFIEAFENVQTQLRSAHTCHVLVHYALNE